MATDPLFKCPRCGAESAHPDDIREGYCGRCHDWTRDDIRPMGWLGYDEKH